MVLGGTLAYLSGARLSIAAVPSHLSQTYLLNVPNETRNQLATTRRMVSAPSSAVVGVAAQAGEAGAVLLSHATDQPQYQGLTVDDRALEVVECLLTGMPRKGARKQLLRLPRLIDDLLPYVRMVMQEMASRSEALNAAHGRDSWQQVWKPMSEHGYDTLSRGLVCVDYGNREYSAVLAVFAALDPMTMLCLERVARYWPAVSVRAPYTEKSCERRGDVMEIFLARLRGHGEEEYGSYLEGPLPLLAAKFCELMRLVQMLDSWDTTWLKWKQVRVQPMRLALPRAGPFLDQWAEGSHRWSNLLLTMYRFGRHMDQLGDR